MIRRRRLRESRRPIRRGRKLYEGVKSKEFMDELVDILVSNVYFDSEVGLLALEPEVSNGESYSGFINFTDGFADYKAAWRAANEDPSYQPHFSNVPPEAQKVIDEILDFDAIYNEIFKDYLDEINDMLPETAKPFKNAKEAVKFWSEYDPNEESDQYDLFGGRTKSGERANLDLFYDKLREKIWEWFDSYYDGREPFLGVRFLLHDGEDGKPNTCTVQSYVCDDLGYGRESVGKWAGNIGNHYIYDKEFKWTDLEDLKRQLEKHVRAAAATIGCEA